MSVADNTRPLVGAVTLLEAERRIAVEIDFDLQHRDDRNRVMRSCELAYELTRTLHARGAIPQIRLDYFIDPQFNGGRKSRKGEFERNGCSGSEIFTHPHFLEYLRYFIWGARLPEPVLATFLGKIRDCEPVTSGDVMPLRALARSLTRQHHLRSREAAEEFFRLCLDCGLSVHYAEAIRDAVKSVR